MISLALLVVAAVVTVVAYVINYSLSQLNKYKDVNKLPGPGLLEVLKATFARGSIYEKYTYISNLNKKYGSVLKLWIKPFDPIIMVADVNYMDRILPSKEHLTKTKMYDLLKPYIGEGIATTSQIPLWKRDRKICNAAFQHNTITGFLPIFNTHTNKFLESLRKETGKVVDTQELMHLYTLDIVFESMVKHGQNFQDNKDSKYIEARVDYFRILANRLYSKFLAHPIIFKFVKDFNVMKKCVVDMKNFTQNIIQLEEKKREDGSYKKSKLHLIDILFESKVPEDVLNDQLNTFILAGHDTVAQAMCFSLYQLSKHMDIQRKLYEEIISIVGKDKDAEITNTDLQDMKFLDCVVKESLRLNTIVPVIERILSDDMNIDGINYPAGTAFMLHIGGVHESEEYYKNANKFDPDRFLPENAHLIRRNSYLPFSSGPRDCIGKLYAMLEIKFFIAKTIQKFEVLPVENHQLQLVSEIIVKSINGIPVIFKERA